eukprot:269442_1
MAAKTPEISLQRDLLRDFMPPTTSDLDIDPEWSRSRTMTLSSMFGSPEISCLLRIIAFLWRWSKPLGCIWIIAVETGLLIHIYWPHTVYFVLSLTFISVPLSISSLFIVYTSYQSMTSRFDSDRITYFSGLRRRCLELLLMIPVVNVLLMLLPPPVVLIKKVHYTLNWQSLFVLILSICMTLPQFILNMSYILCHRNIALLNAVQAVTCLATLSVLTLLHYAHTYALDAIGEQTSMLNAIQLQLFWSKFGYYAEIFFYIYLIPVVLELIHCLPILFEHFYYSHLDAMSLSYLLIGFNTAKMICFSHYIWKISIHKNTKCCSNCMRFVLFVLVLCPLPLVPFMTTTYKALFEKRMLLIDPKRIIQQRASIDNNIKISVADTAVTSYDEESEDSDEKADEHSPITDDLLTYHTMDSNHTMNSNHRIPNASCSANTMNTNYHFEEHSSIKSITSHYILFALYLLISYVGCGACLMLNCGGIFCLGFVTQIMIYVAYLFVLIALVMYTPSVLKRVLDRAQLVLIGDEVRHDALDSIKWTQ